MPVPDGYILDRFSTRQQIAEVRLAAPKASFFSSTFFSGEEVFSPTETIEWDVVTQGAPMARYINPRKPVTPFSRTGYEVREITTPYVQGSRILTVDDLKKRLPGENIYSLRTPQERALQYEAEDLVYCMDSIDARREQQCAAMMTSGIITIDIDEDQPPAHVDYALPNIYTLTGGDRWNQGTSTKMADMRKWFDDLLRRGYVANEVFMSDDVWQCLYTDEELRKALDLRRFEMGIIKPAAVTGYGTAQYKGTLADPLVDIYTFSATYTDPISGAIVPYLPAGRLMMSSPDAKRNRYCNGAVTIMEPGGDFITVEGRYVPEVFNNPQAATKLVRVTGRPLPTPFKYDSWAIAQVL